MDKLNVSWKYLIFLFWLLCGLGCIGTSTSSDQHAQDDPVLRIRQLEAELNARNQEIERLRQQISDLRGFSDDRLQHLVQVQEVSFGRYTLPFDDDEDGIDDGINIYLVVRDRLGDRIKASGSATVEIWDLQAEGNRRLLQKAIYDWDALPHFWLGGVLASHYKFKITWDPDRKPRHSNVTINVQLKDALTGKSYEIQRLVDINIYRKER